MRDDERKIAKKLIDIAIARGWLVSISAEDEDFEIEKSNDRAAIFEAMGAAGYDRVQFYETGKYVGSAMLVYGNEPGVLIADYGTSLDGFIDPVMKYQEKFN